MRARTGRLLLAAASLALAPALALAQDRAVPRGGDGGGGSRGGGSDAGSRHASPSSGSSSSSSSSGSYYGGGSSSSTPSNAERRHPRAGTGSGYYGGGGGYYPGYPVYPGYGWGDWYYPGYGGYWWPYGYGGWYSSYWGYPGGYVGGAVYSSGGGASRDGASLRVLVDPAEARVYVDGYYAGVVDDFDGLLQRLRVAPGRHEIKLKLEGYTTHRMRVYVGPDATLKLRHEMAKGTGETFEDLTGGAPPPERERVRDEDEEEYEPAEPGDDPAAGAGTLELTVEPPDASVYIDGAFRGTGRQASSLKLAPGRHRIEVVRPGFRTAENEIDVPAGETTKIRVILDRPSL